MSGCVVEYKLPSVKKGWRLETHTEKDIRGLVTVGIIMTVVMITTISRRIKISSSVTRRSTGRLRKGSQGWKWRRAVQKKIAEIVAEKAEEVEEARGW